MSLFNKVGQGANKLFNKATGKNGIFNKFNTYARQADNTVQRVGNFIRPISTHFGLEPMVKAGLNTVHDLRVNAVNTSNNLRNALVNSVKAPINEIHHQNSLNAYSNGLERKVKPDVNLMKFPNYR